MLSFLTSLVALNIASFVKVFFALQSKACAKYVWMLNPDVLLSN